MRGTYIVGMIEGSELKLPPGVDLSDFETMYTLLLNARGFATEERLNVNEEKVVLGALCRWSWPLKPASYGVEARTLLSHFRGIASNVKLQAKFRARISKRFSSVSAEEVLDGHAGIYKVHDVLRKARSPSIKAAARRFRREMEMIAG